MSRKMKRGGLQSDVNFLAVVGISIGVDWLNDYHWLGLGLWIGLWLRLWSSPYLFPHGLFPDAIIQVLGMTLDGGGQDLGIMLGRADILMAKHTGQVLHGNIMGQNPSGKSVTGKVGRKLLIQTCTAFDKVKIVVQLLIAHTRKTVVVLLQDLHGGAKDGRVEVGACLDAFTYYII